MNRAAGLISIALAACAALAGCATPNTTTYAAINTPPRPFTRRDPGSVDVFVGNPPARSFVEVGLFEVYQGTVDNGNGRSTQDMVGTLRLHAALRGCDAVQVLGVELAHHRNSGRVVRGVCDMYTDAQPGPAAGQTAAIAPLPGEGSHCSPADPNMAPNLPECPDPLVCSNKVCVSPYR